MTFDAIYYKNDIPNFSEYYKAYYKFKSKEWEINNMPYFQLEIEK